MSMNVLTLIQIGIAVKTSHFYLSLKIGESKACRVFKAFGGVRSLVLVFKTLTKQQ